MLVFRRTWVLASWLPLLSSACLVEAGDEAPVQLAKVASALTVDNTLDQNGIKTAHDAQVAIGAGTDHILAVWVSSANAQIVGQPFSTSASNDGTGGGTVFGEAPFKLKEYSTGTRKKSFPAMAWNHDKNQFLVVWQDDYSATDSDVWGAIIDDKGSLVPLTDNNGNARTNPFTINYDSDAEKMPTVTFVRIGNLGSFLVTYTRKVSAENRTALSSQWVDSNGNAGVVFDTVSSGVSQAASRPTSAYIATSTATQILFTWNDNKFGWAPMEFAHIDTQNTITSAVGLVAAANATPGGESYGLAWRTGDLKTAKINARIYPRGCYSTACATSSELMASNDTLKNLHAPVISAAYKGFGVFAGTEESTWRIRYRTIPVDASKSLDSVTLGCGGSLVSANGRSLGSSAGVIAAVTPPNVLAEPNVRQYMLYDSFCSTPATHAKERVVGINPKTPSDLLHFNVSMNGN